MMPTTREFLGDSLIKELEGAGFSPQSINAFAKNEYRQRKAAQEEDQRRLLYRADDMKLDGKIREALLSGDINEQEAKNAQKFEEFGAKKHGWTLGAAKTVTGIANTIERVGDFINPFYEGKRDKDGNYIYQNGLEKSLRPKIKNVEKMRDDYEKATGETSWGSRLSEIGTELVGDPINFVGGVGLLSKGSKLAQFGKKTLYFAGTGAASGGVAALGEGKNDKETLENIGYGAVGGAFLGHAIDKGIQGISKLIAKRQASKMANEANAIDNAQNSEFLDGGNNASGDVSSGNGSLEYPNTQSIAVTIVRGVLKNEPLSIREQVLKEILSGEEKSSVIKPEKYKSILTGINEYKSYQNRLKHFHDNPDEVKNADLVFDQMQDSFIKANSGDTKKYYDAAPLFGRELKIAQTMTAKEFATKEVGLDEDTATNVLKEAMQGKEKSEFIDADSYNDIVKFKNFETQREYAKAYGEKIQTAQTSINNAREQSAIRYADTQKAIGEYQKQGMSASATRELINAKFKPSADEIDYTRAYNDGADVDARLAGQGIFYALEKDIAAQAYTPEIYATRLKQMGFSDESVQAFTQAYASKDIDIAKEYVNKKVADAYESRVQREVADEINSENRININKDGAYSGHPMLRPDEPSIGQGDLKNDYTQIVKNIASDRNIALRLDPSADVLAIVKDFSQPIKTPIFTSKISVDKMLNHLADKADGERRLEYINLVKPTLENPLFITQETINGAQRFRFFKTFIDEKDKVVKFLNVVEDKNGELLEITATPIKNTDLKNLLKGKIVWGGDALSDLSSPRTTKRGSEADATIISQKGNLINEKAKNSALPNGVSSIGDNASRTGGRQGGDEEILRQSGRNTADASEEKWTAKSDRQMEQRPAFKGDGDTDATAASKQMVEKQGRDDNEIKGENFITMQSPAPKSDLNVKVSVDDWVRELGGINANKQIKADLTKLYEKHKELFAKPSDVFRLIKAVKENPTFFYNNNEPNTALIGKILDNGKLGKIGIQKDYDSEYLKLNHATYSSKADKENKRLLRRNEKSHLVGSPTPTQLTLGKATEPTADGAKALLDEKELKVGTPYPTLQRADINQVGPTAGAKSTFSSSDESIIPQKEINAKTINANSHIASGLVGGTLNSIDEDGNFNPEKFAAGFIEGLAGSKVAALTLKKVAPKFYDNLMNTAKGFSNKGIKEIRSEIEKINGVVPIKEFGENYAEFYHNGKGAVDKLLTERGGQVAGAFYKKELGDIDLVWGNEKFGLAHILKRRSEQWGEEKAIKFLSHLDENIKNGDISQTQNKRVAIKTNKTTIILDNIGENKFVLSAYRDRSNAKSENAKFVQSSDITSKDVEANAKDSSVLLPTDDHIISQNAKTSSASSDAFTKGDNLPSTAFEKDSAFASSSESIIARNEEKVYHSRKIEEIKQEHPNVEKELDESIAAMRKESFNDVNFKDDLINKINAKDITTKQLGKSVDISDKQLAVLKNDIKNADFKVISDSKIYFDKIGRDGDKKRFFIDIAEDGNIRVDGYSKKDIDTIPVRQSALEELAGVGDRARLKNMSFEVKAAYFNELDPIKKEAILKTAELNKLKKAAQSGDKMAVAKFEDFRARNLDENGNIKDGLSLC